MPQRLIRLPLGKQLEWVDVSTSNPSIAASPVCGKYASVMLRAKRLLSRGYSFIEELWSGRLRRGELPSRSSHGIPNLASITSPSRVRRSSLRILLSVTTARGRRRRPHASPRLGWVSVSTAAAGASFSREFSRKMNLPLFLNSFHIRVYGA